MHTRIFGVSIGGNGRHRTVVITAALLCLIPAALYAADNPSPRGAASEVVFIAQIIALLACGRLMGELAQRVGQPPVMGQLISGILLGPSVLGALFPEFQHMLFPDKPEQKAMIDAVGQLGILMLLLLTGMETDLTIFRRSRRAAFSVSLTGIAVPFACGIALGEFLPASLLPHPEARLVTTLFLGTALSISSVKIVAMVVREVGFLRRTVGQVIVSAAIIDDTIGWIIMSVTFGLAAHGSVEFTAVAKSIVGIAVFLALSFTVGRRLVSWIIRWTNDNFATEVPVITAILVVTGGMALITDGIGVHTVLGAFVAGILIGQSPILTKHIDEQLRGLITALFMPVFFGLAGLTTNLTVLADTSLLLLTIALIAIASIGKFSGAFLGGRIGGMSWRESLALGCGMNARGSTEVIVATIGLSMGVLNRDLFTTIVAMAVVTTMSMPPMLRWALARIPIGKEEEERLKREEFEAQGFVSQIERLLVAVDASPSGQYASRLIGLLAGARRIPSTVIHFNYEAQTSDEAERQAARTKSVIKESTETAKDSSAGEPATDTVEVATRVTKPDKPAISTEARKGYGLLFVGREPASEGALFHEQIGQSAADFAGPFAITIARGADREPGRPQRLNILAPVRGTPASRRGAEIAIALAQASNGSVTALHVPGQRSTAPTGWGGQFSTVLTPSGGDAIVREIVELGDPYGVAVRAAVRSRGTPQETILRQLRVGAHNLLVLGVSPRPGDDLFFGDVAAAMLEHAECSLLFVSAEPFTTAQRAPANSAPAPDRTSAAA
jgi:Kef-type K+ transport system membrane component KefB/nucleotide-binding universal stress UspA family protein